MGNISLSATYLLIILSCVSCKESVDCENVLNTKPEDLIETNVKGNITDEGLTLELTGYSGIYVKSVRLIFSTKPLSTYKNETYICLQLLSSEISMLLNETLQTSVSLRANKNVPIGLFMLNRTCLYGGYGLVDCGYFLFLKDMIISPLFMSFPLQEEFWLYLNDESIFRQDWIRELAVRSNEVSIPSSWISNLRLSNLEELAIVGNTWEHPMNLMGYLPRLKKLYLLSNGIVTLPNDLFKNIPSVKIVNLMKNKLESLPQGMSNVKKLDLSYQSSVLSISDDVVSSLENITSLVINTHIEANITNIFRLPHLTSLSCRGCWIHELEVLSSYPWSNDQLLVLDLGSNNLSSLPRMVFENFTLLSTLSLDNNLFVDCPCSLLSSINSLQHLNLSKNSLSEIQPHCFSGLRNLTALDLSWNKLDVLKNSTFENVKNLQYLNLSHNFLSSIQEYSLPSMDKLMFLDLSYNKLIEAPHIKINRLDKLDLSNNFLERATNLVSIKYISYLDLSRNNITELELGRINVLNLTYNAMEFISDDMWKHLESVKVLDLGMNHFLCCHDNFTVLQHRLNTSMEIVRNLNTSGPLYCFPDTQSASVLLPTFNDRDTLCLIEIISVTFLVAAPLGALSFIMIFFAGYIYYYRFEFNYIRFLLNKKESGQRKDDVEAIGCVYDAFVCFSLNDYAWVAGQLLPNLEREPYRYRLCLHTRDFTLGAAIDKNVTEALKKSRKFICVLTKPFLNSKVYSRNLDKSVFRIFHAVIFAYGEATLDIGMEEFLRTMNEWCQWELSKATHKMFTEERDYIILIELEELERTSLPTDLEYLMDSRTYLKWPQDTKNQRGIERCWQRLRHALGDSLVKRTGKEGPEGSVLDL